MCSLRCRIGWMGVRRGDRRKRVEGGAEDVGGML